MFDILRISSYYRSSWNVYTFRSLYCIYQLLQKQTNKQTNKQTKTFYCNDHTITEFGIIDSKNSSTAYVILYELINWLTHDFCTRTGGWEFDGSHGAGTSSPSHWQQVDEQAPKPVGWMMCFLLMTFVLIQKLCVNIYIYIFSIWVLL